MIRMLTAVILTTVTASAADVVELDSRQRERAGVVVQTVTERSFGDSQRVVGRVIQVPGSTLTVKAVIPGRVENLRVAPGDRVRAGQLLIALHSHELLQMQADLLREREQATLAEARLEAGRELYAIEGISRLDLQVREQEAFAANLEVTLSRNELLDHGYPEEALDAVIESRTPDAHLPVVAPIDGVLLELAIETQEWVEEYQELLVIGDPDRVELELQIAPDRAAMVTAGNVVEFTPVGREDLIGRAKVVSKVPRVDPGTRTIKLRAEIVDGGDALYPGVFVEGVIAHGDTRMAAAVPTSAVINIAGGDVVFVELADGKYEARPVTLGVADRGFHEVVTGVDAGDRVATGGVFLLKSALIGGEGEED